MTTSNSLKSSITLLLVILFLNGKISSSSPIEHDAQMVLLTARVDTLQSNMDQLVTRLEEEKLLRRNLHLLNAELENKINQQDELLGAKIDLLLAKNFQQDEEINQLKNKVKILYVADSNTQQKVPLNGKDGTMINTSANDLISDDSSPRLPPSSCRQLSTIGHYLDGIYLVANPDTNKIEAVYCDFGSSTLSETLYGSVDVKTKSVHFFVQRSFSFTLIDDVLRFEMERLNVGGAMNMETGTFTAPLDGIYHFQFSALKGVNAPANAYIYLQVNGVNISSSYAPSDLSSFLTLSGINAFLRLKTGDQVRLYGNASLADNSSNRYTHFTGWLVEEELTLA